MLGYDLMQSVTPSSESGPTESSAGAVRASYRSVRAQSLALSARLSPEDCQAQSMPDASPVKWHLAHTTWFFANFVLEAAGRAPFGEVPRYRSLFNSYYQGVGPAHTRHARGLLVRPALEEVLAFRARIDEQILSLSDAELERWANLIELGLHHEQQHQELMLTDVKHLFWSIDAVYDPRLADEDVWGHGKTRVEEGFRAFGAELIEVGAAATGFAYDNERPRHRVWLEPFEVRNTCVTHREVIAFMQADGYRTPSLWMDSGYAWARTQELAHPLYYRQTASGFEHFSLAGWVPLEGARLDAPCGHLSWYEADAIARFLGLRLLSEFEWERWCAAQGSVVYGLWEWTGSAYRPYPGFAPEPGVVGEYNGKFMDGCYVLRGASLFTAPGHARLSYRNFFAPTARWQRSGARLGRHRVAERNCT
jgi:ergothioneine biosynthesis protein EgtB